MNEISPLVLVLFEFYVILGLVALAVFLWSIEHFKRLREREATKQLQEIFSLAAEALRERSSEKCSAVNLRIDQWDEAFARTFGAAIPRVNAT